MLFMFYVEHENNYKYEQSGRLYRMCGQMSKAIMLFIFCVEYEDKCQYLHKPIRNVGLRLMGILKIKILADMLDFLLGIFILYQVTFYW